MTTPIVDLRNIHMTIRDLIVWQAEDGSFMCRIVTISPNGSRTSRLEFEIEDSPKLFQALRTIGDTNRILNVGAG